jgi:hypothetical protein
MNDSTIHPATQRFHHLFGPIRGEYDGQYERKSTFERECQEFVKMYQSATHANPIIEF